MQTNKNILALLQHNTNRKEHRLWLYSLMNYEKVNISEYHTPSRPRNRTLLAPQYWIWFLVLCSRFLFFIFFIYSSVYIGEGNGSPLQCFCLDNPRDGGAWWAAVYGVAQSRTRVKRLSSSSSVCILILNSMEVSLTN